FSVPDLKPIVVISSPPEGAIYKSNEKITLEAIGFDPEDQSVDGASFQWKSDIQGELGSGKKLLVSSLKTGQHIISVRIRDTSGQLAEANVSITVNTAPAHKSQNKPKVTLLCSTMDPTEGKPMKFVATASDQDAQDKLTYLWYLDGQPVDWTGLSPKWRDPKPGAHNVAIMVSHGKEKVKKVVAFTVAASAPLPPPSASSIINQILLSDSIPPSPWNQKNVFAPGDAIYVWVESKSLNSPHTLEIVWSNPSGTELKREQFDLRGWGASEIHWSEFKTSAGTMNGRWRIHLFIDGKVGNSLSFVLQP
ncbi:MAG: hypothetical protein P8165_11675, partial [Deltaproteobacteria bacterium]